MRRSLLSLVLTGIGATVLFYLIVHMLSGVWLDLTLRPEVRRVVEQSLEDQKRLSELEPQRADEYQRTFAANQELLNRIDVILMNRERMLFRFEILLVICFALTITIGSTIWWRRQRAGELQRRQEYVDRLRSWQEASRRHAHEIRTPLTAARMELERLQSSAERGDRDEVINAASSVFEEFDRIASFTRQFSSFATIARPALELHSLGSLLDEFCEVFERAWPNLSFRVLGIPSQDRVLCDRDLLRQVFVNLATNSSRAIDGDGELRFTAERHGDRMIIDVEDTGGGIPDGIRSRIFEPYVTTREVGEGMGLGLPISRKILLDHGGDLRLLRSGPDGTVFRLILQAA